MLTSLEVFLAHAIALEADSAERFDELADTLEVHFETEIVALFRRMAHYSRLHLAEVQEAAAGLTLPRLAPWDYQWPDHEPPETVTHDQIHYRITPRQALTQALRSEERGEAFYATVAATTTDPAIKRLAEEFAAEEAGHVSMLAQWLETLPDIDPIRHDDPDEPHME